MSPAATPDADGDRFRRAQEIFEQAWSLAPEQRAAFLRERCAGDSSLVDEVQRLLHEAEADNTFELQGAARPQSDTPKEIGPYRILQKLGEGGMGVVYLAEQRVPVRRRVALKVMKLGMDSKAFLARFEVERQALAMMEHSCIAKVFDAGASDAGQPWLAMEYVKGVPITEYCDDNKLGIVERIELFVMICSAIQHAHNKGVIHRDLKPSNILVTVQDGAPHPTIIDFGLAKALDHRLVEATVFTEHGQIIGTPEYMSPEQAGVGGLDIDTRSDVFSLGVLLYQLLTGTLPVTREELLKQGWYEMQRHIREGEVPKPSTKVTTLGVGAEAYARARRLPLGELQKKLRGELDWIVMKALEKDRGRRYTTVHEFAADLLHHLRDEPVSAGPPSASYVLRKVLRRHRGLVMGVSGALVALCIGLAFALWQWREAETAKAVANEERANANREKEKAQELESQFSALSRDSKFPSLAVQLRRLIRREAALPPEGSAAVPAYERWVADAEAWKAQLPDMDALLSELGARAQAVDGELQFDDPSAEMVFHALSELRDAASMLIAPNGLLSRARSSLDWSRDVARRTIDECTDAWTKVARDVRAHPDFGGLTLAPQEGLIPLGANAHGYQEFLFARSGVAPVRSGGPAKEVEPNEGIVLVLLPGGVAHIGSDAAQVESGVAEENETPRLEVTIAPFFLSKYEMTQAQWLRLAGANPSKYQAPQSGAFPVESVAWVDIVPRLEKLGLQLPTEIQWEYGCRAGSDTLWCFGDDEGDLIKDKRGRFNAASGRIPEAKMNPGYEDGFEIHMRVGSYEPNGFGLFDMHGNIGELTRSPMGSYVGATFDNDGLMMSSGKPMSQDFAVMRGGSYWKNIMAARSAHRTDIEKRGRWDNIGFRVARPLFR